MATYQTFGYAGSHTAAIAAALKVNHGTGRPDLSDTNAVAVGRFDKPPQLPFVALDLVGIDDSFDGQPMGTVEHTVEIFVEGWAASAGDTPLLSTFYGLYLAQSCTKLLHDAFYDSAGSLKSLGLRTLNIDRHEFANTEINGRKIGHWRATMTFTYLTSSTTGRGL